MSDAEQTKRGRRRKGEKQLSRAEIISVAIKLIDRNGIEAFSMRNLATELVADKSTKDMIPVEHRAVYRLLEIGTKKGLLLYTRKTGGQFGEWVMVTPPLTLSHAEADELLILLHKTIRDLETEPASKGVLQAA